MKKSQPDRPGNSAVSIGKRVRPRALRKAGVKEGAALQSQDLRAQARRAAPDVTAYLQHEEVTPGQWQRIWDETAPQSRRRDFGRLVKAVGPLPMTALATSTTNTNGVHGGAGTD